ncbi:Swi5-domain-containing protein, partial [Sporormia fimetaria CBS 119925]
PAPDGEPTDAEVMGAAHKIVKKHIKLLHEYNEIKDVGQGLMGLIADQRGVRIIEIQEEFGI